MFSERITWNILLLKKVRVAVETIDSFPEIKVCKRSADQAERETGKKEINYKNIGEITSKKACS